MSSERSIETTGESVEEAISKGLAELGGVSPTDVIVEVLEEPSRGMFGLGARPARVRLQLFRTPAATTPTPVSTPVSVPSPTPESNPARDKHEAEEAFTAEVDEDEGISLLEDMQEITDDSESDSNSDSKSNGKASESRVKSPKAKPAK
jgi:predicted RNA-binding protein Jag